MMTLNSLSPSAESISLCFLDTSRFTQTPKLPVVTGGCSLRKRNQGRSFGKGVVKCSVEVQQQQQQQPPPAWPGRAIPEPPRQSWDGPKPISIVGSTGSIGTQVLYHYSSSIAWIIRTLFCFFAYSDWPVEKLKEVKVADALKHPNWSMGKKITVDSATLFNKGLEVIEAHYLFGAEYDDIEIVIHPQSIIHSMIETQDSSVLAQLGWPDMRLPILYTMSWPDRVPCSEVTWPRLDLCKLGSLTFKKPDNVKYPSMDLAYAAGRAGGTMTGVLSAANEKAVEMFIDEKISYLDIFKVVELTCDKHRSELVTSPSLEEIVHYDLWAREYAANVQLSSGARPVPA
ncbi:hypothetical protein DY000_02006020 [Brassica cretica]|uniref:1-deoxy-D-xylulose-5-phosphate reductoisomerase n=1 Tax=Brassica cretica TaxID=69181 RepID=A0ABQ7CH63_BRACR|nr:hypothetical protein DY000_02006020 [Brassica cretica]